MLVLGSASKPISSAHRYIHIEIMYNGNGRERSQELKKRRIHDCPRVGKGNDKV